MPSKALKNFRALWADACKTMWIEVAAIRHLESQLRGNYAQIDDKAVLTDWVYAPECKGRIDDTTKDFVLGRVIDLINSAVTPRVVLLSAAFESYFEEFFSQYLQARAKYYVAGARTAAGNKVWGDVMKQRGPSARIRELGVAANAGIKVLMSNLPVLEEVYVLRNSIAHDAGVVDAFTAANVKSIAAVQGTQLRVTPHELVSVLAPPCLSVAEELDKKLT